MLERYKSWSQMRKQAEGLLCASLRGKITYFFTNYHDVHNVYGRAAIRLSGRELVCFSWIERYRQERDISAFYNADPALRFDDSREKLDYILQKQKPVWDANCTHDDSDFIAALQAFFHLAIEDALASDDYIVKIFAIMDRRTGKRTLHRIKNAGEFAGYPDWVQTFYKLRFDADGI